MNGQATIDVSKLPNSALDHRSPIWWGNILLLCIETTMFVLCVASYFYLRMNFSTWPPPRVENGPPLYDSVPSLGVPLLNLALILLSVVPMVIVDLACLRRDARTVKIALAINILMGVAAIVVRFYEFPALHFSWNDNAYASIVWTILGLHLTHLLVSTTENGLMATWVFTKGMDDKHARDIRVTATYWYWIAAIWLPLFAVIYLAPRFI
jgi:heme/copper-type cytochrome/quinol oxidase subunit 3